MSTAQQTLLTPREARQIRRLVIAFDLALCSIVLSTLALAFPFAIAMLRSVSSVETTIRFANLFLPLLSWFLAASNALSVASAFLFLGAPLRMRCFPEAMTFAVLTLLISLVTSLSGLVALPKLLEFSTTAASFFLVPIVVLLLFRKAAIFVSSREDLVTARSIANLIFVSAMLIEIGISLPNVIGYFSIPAEILPLAVLVPVLPILVAVVCFALVLLGVFRLQWSLRRKFRLVWNEQTSGVVSPNASRTSPTGGSPLGDINPRGSKGILASETSRFSPVPMGFVKSLCALTAVVLICEVSNFVIARAERNKVEAAQYAESANRYNSELWVKARTPSGASSINLEAIRKMESICVSFPKWEYLNTLGVAQYRVGDFQAAKVSLERSMNASKSLGDPSDLAFLAMSYQKLGQSDLAKNIRSRLIELMKLDRFKNNPESLGFVREVDELFNENAPPSGGE